MLKERYELSIDPIEIPEKDIDLFIVDGKFNTRNHNPLSVFRFVSRNNIGKGIFCCRVIKDLTFVRIFRKVNPLVVSHKSIL